MKILIEGNDENISFIVDRIRETFAVKSIANNHFKISDLDNETFQERAIETLEAILQKVEEETNKTQEE
jgi:hypothetical protein